MIDKDILTKCELEYIFDQYPNEKFIVVSHDNIANWRSCQPIRLHDTNALSTYPWCGRSSDDFPVLLESDKFICRHRWNMSGVYGPFEKYFYFFHRKLTQMLT